MSGELHELIFAAISTVDPNPKWAEEQASAAVLAITANPEVVLRALSEHSAEEIERLLARSSAAANESKFYPFGRLDPNDSIDQAIVNAFNKGAEDA